MFQLVPLPPENGCCRKTAPFGGPWPTFVQVQVRPQKKVWWFPFDDLLYSPRYSVALVSYVIVAVCPIMSYSICTGCYTKQGGHGHKAGSQAQVHVALGPRADFHFSSIFFRIFDFGKI